MSETNIASGDPNNRTDSCVSSYQLKSGAWIAYETGKVVTILAKGTTEQEARDRVWLYIFEQGKHDYSRMYDDDGPCFNCDH